MSALDRVSPSRSALRAPLLTPLLALPGVLTLLLLSACGDDGMVGPCGMALCPGDDAAVDGSDDAGTDAGGDAGDASSPDVGTTPGDEAVVDGAWLVANAETVQTVDVRAASSYETGRVPGAVLVDPGALRATVDGVPGQVAGASAVIAEFSGAGLDAGGTVVVYGDGVDTTAARVVWTLAYYGHEDVRLLDGGYTAYTSAGGSSEGGTPSPTPGTWTSAGAVTELGADADYVLAHLDDENVVLVDARSQAEFDGGHIPGALSIDWSQSVAGGAYRPMDEVVALFEGIDRGATVVSYCQTGSRASVNWVTLRWLGFTDVRLYDGSWAEWGSRPELPQEP